MFTKANLDKTFFELRFLIRRRFSLSLSWLQFDPNYSLLPLDGLKKLKFKISRTGASPVFTVCHKVISL